MVQAVLFIVAFALMLAAALGVTSKRVSTSTLAWALFILAVGWPAVTQAF